MYYGYYYYWNVIDIFLPKCHLTTVRSRVRANELQLAFLNRGFDSTVLLKQPAYRNRREFLGRYGDVSPYTFTLLTTCKYSDCGKPRHTRGGVTVSAFVAYAVDALLV